MHWPTVHIMEQRFDLVLSHEYEQRRYENSLFAETFVKQLNVNDIYIVQSMLVCMN